MRRAAPWAFFDDLFTNAPQKAAAAAQTQGLNAGYGQLSDLYGQGRDALTSNTSQATSLYQPLIASTTGGSNAYGDATGANGADGLARAQALFTQTPGYQEGLNQTLDQNDRRAASRGMLNSGNTIADTTKLATDYASQKYGSYVSGLQPYLGANQGAVGGAAGLYSGLGSGINASYQGQGTAANAAQTGIGNANANADLARVGAAGNLFNTALGVGKAAASIAGAFADGGRPPVGQPSLVGERGPEVFVPDQPGTIVPNMAGRMAQGLSEAQNRAAAAIISAQQAQEENKATAAMEELRRRMRTNYVSPGLRGESTIGGIESRYISDAVPRNPGAP